MEVYTSSDEGSYHASSDEADDRWLDAIAPPASPSPSESISVITREALLAAQSKDLGTIMSILVVKEQHARTLLVHYRWDVDTILTVFTEKGRDELFAIAGVVESSLEVPAMDSCRICIEDVSGDDVTAMDCGHYFCNSCWTGYLDRKITGGHSGRILCMEDECRWVCDEEKVRALVNARDPDLAERFEHVLLGSYMESNQKVNWCPSKPHCGNALRKNRDSDGLCEAECSCGHRFCFGCLSEAHSPSSCQMWEFWTRKCREVDFMTGNVKPCPVCGAIVEKNGECNEVRCVCEQKFCWLCMQATWDNLQEHICVSVLQDKRNKAAEEEYKDRHLEMHYGARYLAHKESFRLENRMKEAMEARTSKLEENAMSRDTSWVTNGLHRLFRSREILLNTYAFAYCMFGEIGVEISEDELKWKRELFENHRQNLEELVEKLSKGLREKFEEYSSDEVLKLRSKVIDLTVLIDNSCRTLYKYIEDELLGSLKNTAHQIAPYKS